MLLRKFLKALRAKKDYEPLIEVHISKDALLHNFNVFKRRMPKGSVAPVLKSNSYGHGLVEVATILEKQKGIPFLCVDSYFEARTLRHEGITTPLLILGYTQDETILNSQLKNISFSVHSLDQLYALKNTRKNISIHLKLDTGMHRYGILQDELQTALTYIKNHSHIVLSGSFSHFADADGEHDAFTREQIRIWNGSVQKIRNEIKTVQYFHTAQTAGSYFAEHIDANVLRLGLGLYGLTTQPIDPVKHELKPVLSLHTIITSIKRIKKGETVGYNGTFIAPENMTIATIPIGYSEGLDRSLANCGFVYVGNKPCPIIGKVSMNIATIDVSRVENIKRGNHVEVISDDPTRKNSVTEIDKISAAFEYEVLVHIPRHLKRVIV